MTDTRKDIRFQLPAASGPDFDAAKRRAEQELGVSMSNNEFAKRALVQAVRGANDGDHITGTVTKTWYTETGDKMAEVRL